MVHSVLHLEEVQKPAPQNDEVLVNYIVRLAVVLTAQYNALYWMAQ